MNDYKYPPLTVTRKTGAEQFTGANVSKRLIDYWMWAHSNMCSNAERGKFAEYIVSLAMNAADGVGDEWGAYDVLSPEGIRIEVKTSAYIQTWGQKTFSRIVFGIKPTRELDEWTNQYYDEAKRQSDVYVFCVENCKDQSELNPLDLDQWDFYPVSTALLNEKLGDQKSISLVSLENLEVSLCKYAELRKEIIEQYRKYHETDIG